MTRQRSYRKRGNDQRSKKSSERILVPVDAFWSVIVYDAEGHLKKNDLNAYSLLYGELRENVANSHRIAAIAGRIVEDGRALALEFPAFAGVWRQSGSRDA